MIYLILQEEIQSCNFADQSITYSCNSDFDSIIQNHKYDLIILPKLSKINSMEPN